MSRLFRIHRPNWPGFGHCKLKTNNTKCDTLSSADGSWSPLKIGIMKAVPRGGIKNQKWISIGADWGGTWLEKLLCFIAPKWTKNFNHLGVLILLDVLPFSVKTMLNYTTSYIYTQICEEISASVTIASINIFLKDLGAFQLALQSIVVNVFITFCGAKFGNFWLLFKCQLGSSAKMSIQVNHTLPIDFL